jgi:3-hydroxybutyryl-CoA dehydrogenase
MGDTLCILGAGTMGRGIAAAALAAGFDTTLVDVDFGALSSAREAIAHRLTRDAPDAARIEALSLLSELEPAVAVADVVIEAVPELIELKRDVFARLHRSAQAGALLATNTSTISVSELAEACGSSERVIGMHFFNPVHRMALVEIVVGDTTSDETVADALALVARLGKEPVVVKDVPGFVTSRLGLLLGNEAMRIVEEGIASAADVDKAMRLGYGHPMGPLELADLVGLDARLNNLRSMHEQSRLEQYRPPAILEQLVAVGRLGRKTGSGFFDYDEDGVARR